MYANTKLNAMPPQKPSHDFLGEMRSNNRFFPIADPTIERERKRILLQGDVPSPVNLPQGCNFCNRCPYATQLCKERKPQLREIEPGHFTACHRAEEM